MPKFVCTPAERFRRTYARLCTGLGNHCRLSGSGALHAYELLLLMVLDVVQLSLFELAGSELARARLALVGLQVVRMKPSCTALVADEFRLLRRKVFAAFFGRPVLQLMCFVTFVALEPASELRLTLPAHQKGFLSLELVGSELARARLALVCLQVIGVKALGTAGLAN